LLPGPFWDDGWWSRSTIFEQNSGFQTVSTLNPWMIYIEPDLWKWWCLTIICVTDIFRQARMAGLDVPTSCNYLGLSVLPYLPGVDAAELSCGKKGWLDHHQGECGAT
jgi:hypothetical protein